MRATGDSVGSAHLPGGGTSPRGSRARNLITGLLLLGTLAIAWQTRELVLQNQRARFDHEVGRIELAVEQRMGAYVQVLRGGHGLFDVNGDVTLDQWLRYVDALQLAEHYPGFKSLSFAAAVQPDAVDAFVHGVRAWPLPPGLKDPALIREFHLRSPVAQGAEPPVHSPIVFVAPMIPANERVLGVDMMQEPLRRDAMERAASTGSAVLSPRLNLAGQGDARAGFIAYLAVRNGDELRGWLTAAFLADDFMRGLLGSGPQNVDFAVFDGPSASQASLLYSTAGLDADGSPAPLAAPGAGAEIRTGSLTLAGRQWTFQFQATSRFGSVTDRFAPWLALIGGLLGTLLYHSTSRAETRVRHQATHDGLTGLSNRNLFMARLGEAVARSRAGGRPLAIAYIDIDGFKAVNDTHGHHVGDQLLGAIASRLASHARSDDVLARLGGDEFAAILEDTDDAAAAARRFGDAVVEALHRPFALGEGRDEVRVAIGASVGIALFPAHGPDADALLVAADRAMYAAKRAGKGRCVVGEGSAEASAVA